MKPEEKFDRIVGRIVRDDLPERLSPGFTDNVLERLGVRRIQPQAVLCC
jgi:hypothetical protein